MPSVAKLAEDRLIATPSNLLICGLAALLH